MKYLYKFYWDCAYGKLDGLFLADPDQVKKVIGKTIYFGDVLGKHSDVYGTLDDDSLTLISDNAELLFEDLFDDDTLCGYNPIEWWEENHEDYEDGDE